MDDIVLGILAVLAGAVLCLRGYWALRVIIALWGAFVGFGLGAGLVASFAGETFLGSVLGWVVGVVVAVVLAALAYLYYAVGVVLAMASFGFVLGSAAMTGLGVTWSWLVVLVAVALGLLLAVVAVVAHLPMVLLVVSSALTGAAAVVGGVMLLVGRLDTTALSTTSVTDQISHDWYWYLAYVLLALLGIVVQARATVVRADVREVWERTA